VCESERVKNFFWLIAHIIQLYHLIIISPHPRNQAKTSTLSLLAVAVENRVSEIIKNRLFLKGFGGLEG